MLCQLSSALSLFLCHNVGMLFHLFLEKNENFPILIAITVHLEQDRIVITSISSVSNLVVTRENSLRKHQLKKYLFCSIFFNQSKIQFETLEEYRHSEERLTYHL